MSGLLRPNIPIPTVLQPSNAVLVDSAQHVPTDLYIDDEIIDFYDDNIDDATTEESDTTLPDTEIQDQAPIPVLTTLLSPSTPTTRLQREPTRGSRPLPPAINASIADPSPPVSLHIDLPEATIDLASADVLTSTRLQPPPLPTVPAPPPSPPYIVVCTIYSDDPCSS